eukprot:364570-Chlamydomonas_euryale.AAC.18
MDAADMVVAEVGSALVAVLHLSFAMRSRLIRPSSAASLPHLPIPARNPRLHAHTPDTSRICCLSTPPTHPRP